MDDSNSSAESWLDIAQMDAQQDSLCHLWQDAPVKSREEVQDPISLFGQFVSVVSSNVLKNIQSQSEFSTFVRDMCTKAPSVAQYLVHEILNHSKDDSQPEVQGSKVLKKSTTPNRLPKRRKQSDSSYQPSRPSRTQPDAPNDRAENSRKVDSVSSQIGNKFVTCQPGHDNMTINQSSELIAEEVSQNGVVPQEGVQGQTYGHGRTLRSMSSESTTDQLKAMYSSEDIKRNTVYRQSSVALDKSAEDNQPIFCSILQGEADQREIALSEIDGKASDPQAPSVTSLPHGAEPHGIVLSNPIPSTPVQQICRGFPSPLSSDQTSTPQTALFTPTINREALSPLTEDDRTASPPDKTERTVPEGIPSPPSSLRLQQTSLCKTASTLAPQLDGEQLDPAQDSPAILPLSPPEETFADMVAKAVHIIYKMSRRQEVPTEVHARILTTIRPSLSGTSATTATTAAAEHTDSVWITSSSKTWSASMWINMLEAGHARSKEVTILNMIEWMGASEWYDAELEQAEKAPPPTKRGKPRKRLATVVLDKYLKEARDTTAVESMENLSSIDSKDCPLSLDSAGIQKRILNARRRKLNNIFHRGRTLRKLVQMTHLGILFDPNIWSYAKASKENIEEITARFQADPQKMELLSILEEQVELLAMEGQPDLARFLESLESRTILLSEEVSTLRAEYGLESEPVPQSCLDTAIRQVVEGFGRVLGKHPLGKDDYIMVNGAVELSCSLFDRLRSREWLNCWDIAAALDMTDRPVFVQLGLSIPLHKKEANGEAISISNPLRRWRKQINDYRREGKNDLERTHVYMCPLNVNANHFTLLEINEQTKMIYHYDSMASHGTISRRTKSNLVRRVVEAEFQDLGFGYIEAPTPQQRDGWSCGLMVVRNARRRMMGLQVGTWDDEVDPDQVIKEVVRDCQTFLDGGALQPCRLSKKRKIDEGLQGVPAPIRSSKRLRK